MHLSPKISAFKVSHHLIHILFAKIERPKKILDDKCQTLQLVEFQINFDLSAEETRQLQWICAMKWVVRGASKKKLWHAFRNSVCNPDIPKWSMPNMFAQYPVHSNSLQIDSIGMGQLWFIIDWLIICGRSNMVQLWKLMHYATGNWGQSKLTFATQIEAIQRALLRYKKRAKWYSECLAIVDIPTSLFLASSRLQLQKSCSHAWCKTRGHKCKKACQSSPATNGKARKRNNATHTSLLQYNIQSACGSIYV